MAYKENTSVSILTTLAFILLLAYFSYHAISGDRGLLALMELTKRVDQAKEKLDTTSAERLDLEHRVTLLRDDSLDIDLLDEQARRLLGYVAPDETVYITQKK